MALLLGLLLFALPFLLYLLWWRQATRRVEGGPPVVVLILGGVGIALALGTAVYFGLSRSLERGGTYVPARLEDGEVRR